jgi:plastocyanin
MPASVRLAPVRPLRLVLPLLACALLVPAAAQAADHVVYAGAPQPEARHVPASFEVVGFYPGSITIHEGDTVTWRFTGRLHMVTLPTTTGQRPLFGWIDPSRKLTGKDAAGKPFWWQGQPTQYVPADAARRDSGAPFDGTSVRNSGLPSQTSAPTKPYRLKFVKQGIFTVLCIVHPTMHMTVTVVPRGMPLESKRSVDAEMHRSFRHTEALATRLTKAARPPKNTVYAGYDAGDVSLLRFFPGERTVKAGGTIDFVLKSVKESHAITFGPPALRKDIGEHIIQPLDSPGLGRIQAFNPLIFSPSDPESAFPAYTGGNHGNGYLNTGALDNDPLTPYDDRQPVRFTKPGTYLYECPIHPGMTAKIRVIR